MSESQYSAAANPSHPIPDATYTEKPTYLDAHGVDTGKPPAPSGGISRWLWIILAILAILLAAAIVSGILSRRHDETKLETVTKEGSVPTVSVMHPISSRLAPEISLPGSAQAYVDTPIYARTNGYLKSWHYDIGAHVRKGQLLAVIETPELDQQLQVAEAQLKSAQANLDLANITSTRYQGLLKTNSVSKQETDQAMSDAAAKQAAVEAAMAGVRRLEQLQSFEKIYAPFDGVITARNTDVGQLITGGIDTGNAARELFHLAEIHTIRVFVPVPQAYAAAVKDGGAATLTLDEYPGRTFVGRIARNSSAIDPSSRTLNVEVDVDNPKAELLPGAYVTVHFKVADHGEVLTIPSNTLIFRSQGLQVAVVRDGKVALTPIKVSRDAGAFVEISAGITASDLIVLDPSDSIASGQQVTTRERKVELPTQKAAK
ncbi:efflux RND transporter periplasmic adaptor subunit [Granulicella sp. WH15]|uniref:efflux RND transporter periplasmic adaptor subunit n=1 Tax=Granulicella sp. WH15 TaxID=2602070 RepID=UPI00136704B0|nr:efflux RND transporter periplasmic adaptor subunit [Granulicella sp. WH15]QHN04633.1 efflux RND transporter periplasmic adaptor subunit [Granulicella sp. WH15]